MDCNNKPDFRRDGDNNNSFPKAGPSIAGFPVKDYGERKGQRFTALCSFCEGSQDVFLRMDPNSTAEISGMIVRFFSALSQQGQAPLTAFVKKPGSACLVFFDTMEEWYRGKILETYQDGFFKIFLVDQGWTVKVPNEKIHYCPSQLRSIPEGVTRAAIIGATGSEPFEERKKLKNFLENKLFLTEVHSLKVGSDGKPRIQVSLSHLDGTPLGPHIMELLGLAKSDKRPHTAAEHCSRFSGIQQQQQHSMKPTAVSQGSAAVAAKRQEETADAKLRLKEREIEMLKKELEWKEEKGSLEKTIHRLEAERDRKAEEIKILTRKLQHANAELQHLRREKQRPSTVVNIEEVTLDPLIKQEPSDPSVVFQSTSTPAKSPSVDSSSAQSSIAGTSRGGNSDLRMSLDDWGSPLMTRSEQHSWPASEGVSSDEWEDEVESCRVENQPGKSIRGGYRNGQRDALPGRIIGRRGRGRGRGRGSDHKRYKPYCRSKNIGLEPCWACANAGINIPIYHCIEECPSIRICTKLDGTKICLRCREDHTIHTCPHK